MLRLQKGMVLIEIIFAVLLISFAAVTFVMFQSNQTYTDDISAQQSDAIIAAISKLESLTQYSSSTAYSAIASGTSTVTGNNTTYNLAWTVTNFTSPTYLTINMVVTWTDRRNTSQSINLVTQLANTNPALSASIM